MSRRQRHLILGDEPRTARQERSSQAVVPIWNSCVLVAIAHQWHQTIRRVWHHLCNVGHQTGMKVLSPGVKQKKRQEREKNRCRALSRIRTWKINRRKKVGSENQLATFFWKLLRKKKNFLRNVFRSKVAPRDEEIKNSWKNRMEEIEKSVSARVCVSVSERERVCACRLVLVCVCTCVDVKLMRERKSQLLKINRAFSAK